MISEPLQTERMDDGRRLLLRDLIVGLGYVDPELVPFHDSKSGAAGLGPRNSQYGTIIRVPTGFDTDYSSVPVLGRLVMGRWDRHDIAGVVHDWLYRVGAPRSSADTAWRTIATSGTRRVGPVRGFLGWAGLRLGGWVSYRSRARERGEG